MKPPLPRKVIVFCLPGIGDAILFTPALAALRRALPEAQITVITMFRGTADILFTNPDVNEVRQFDFFNAGRWAGLRYVWKLRQEGFDLSLMPFPSNRLEYNLVNRLVGRRWRAAHRYRYQSWVNLWFVNNICVREDERRHNVEENLCLVEAVCERLGLAAPIPAQPQLKLALTTADNAYGERFLRERNLDPRTILFGLHTYSSTFKNMNRKCWDKDQFVALIRQLSQVHPDARFLIFSGPSDEAVNQYIMQDAPGGVVLVREPNLRQALAVLKRCRLFISNDSAIMHLAAALDVPVVALFGPTNWQRLRPWNQAHAIVRRDLPCMPCFQYSSRPLRCVANLNYACMREILVEEVFETVERLLRETAASSA